MSKETIDAMNMALDIISRTTSSAFVKTMLEEAIKREEAQTVEPSKCAFPEVCPEHCHEFYAKQPVSGEREALIAELTEFIETLEAGGAIRSVAMARKASDMLAADVQHAGHDIPLELLQRLEKTLTNLGYATPEGGIESFNAQLEIQLYHLCAGVDKLISGIKVAQKVAVPHGWKLVPVEPTQEMISVGDKCWQQMALGEETYQAMLAEVPQPPHPASRVPMTEPEINNMHAALPKTLAVARAVLAAQRAKA